MRKITIIIDADKRHIEMEYQDLPCNLGHPQSSMSALLDTAVKDAREYVWERFTEDVQPCTHIGAEG